MRRSRVSEHVKSKTDIYTSPRKKTGTTKKVILELVAPFEDADFEINKEWNYSQLTTEDSLITDYFVVNL